jgi:hypothetical protein
VTHELQPADSVVPKSFLRNNILSFSDEARFHLSGYVNSQNNRLWSCDSPHAYHETQLQPVKIDAWYAVSSSLSLSLSLFFFFFFDPVDAERCHGVLMQFIALLEVDGKNSWLQQDGST